MLLGLGIYWGSGTTAQEASPEAASGVIPPLLTQWAEAWSSGDPEQVVALYAPDAVYEEVPTNSDLQGHDEIRTFVEDTHATTSDIQVTPRRGFQAEDWAVLEGDFTGRSAEGVAFSVPFIVVMELDGDLIRRSADYFDVNSILTQIGAGTGTPAAAAEDAVAVSLTEFAIDMPTELAAGPVTFQVTNDGTTDHNFEVEGQGIEEELPQNLAPGQSGTLSLDLAAGTYEVYCPVDDHAAHGMRLELTVTG
jgi:steroid delta-isomerase-like uncharacterized protein